MLGQLNRRDDGHRDTATSTGLPLNTAATGTLRPVVAVLGHPGRVASLPSYLPAGWVLRRPRDLDDVDPDDIVLLTRATVAEVAMARRVLTRRTRVVALVDETAPAETVAGVLTAGADVCVRAGRSAILAGHLVACRRRQLADRWAAMQSAIASGNAGARDTGVRGAGVRDTSARDTSARDTGVRGAGARGAGVRWDAVDRA